MSSPLICIDAYGGQFWPWALKAKVAREVLGSDVVFPARFIRGEFVWLDKIVEKVGDTTHDTLTFSSVPLIVPFLDAIEKLGLTNTLTQRDREISHKWPIYVKPEFSWREIAVCTFNECTPEFLNSFTRPWDEEVFAKTLVKKSAGHGIVITVSELLWAHEKGLPVVETSGESSFVTIAADEPMIISQPIEIAEDSENIRIEYRSWIVNHTLSSVSRYWFENKPIDNPSDDILSFINRFILAHKDVLPKHYVLDFALTKSGQMVVVEVNFFWESGIAGDADTQGAVLNRLFTSIKQGSTV